MLTQTNEDCVTETLRWCAEVDRRVDAEVRADFAEADRMRWVAKFWIAATSAAVAWSIMIIMMLK